MQKDLMKSSSSDNLASVYGIEVFHLFGPELQLIKTNRYVRWVEKVQIFLVLEHDKKDDHKVSGKLVSNDSEIDEENKNLC